MEYSDTTWALLFNASEGSVFAVASLRQALAGIALQNLSVPSSGLFTEVTGLVPDGLTVDGIDYRDAAGDLLPTIPDAKALYMQARQGMASSDFNGVTILLPQGSGLTETVEQINGAWQKDCSLFFSVEEVPQEEFDARLASGKYTIALAPICAEGGSVYQMLQQFTAEGGGLTGYSDPLYTERLAESAQQTFVHIAENSYLCHRNGNKTSEYGKQKASGRSQEECRNTQLHTVGTLYLS